MLRESTSPLLLPRFAALSAAATLPTLILALLLLLTACEEDAFRDDATEIIQHGRLELLGNAPLRLPCKQLDGSVKVFSIQPWDLIFLGWRFDGVPEDAEHFVPAAIPGPYDHVMVYLGKDSAGFGYIAELTTAPSLELHVDGPRVYQDGQLFIRALGTDDLAKRHESGDRFFLSTNYNVSAVRRLVPGLREVLLAGQSALRERIRTDHERRIRFQVPIRVDLQAFLLRNEIALTDDGYENGAFCAEYWVELYEKIGGVCLHNSRMNALRVASYLRNDPDAAYALIPASQNPFTRQDINLQERVKAGLRLLDPAPYACAVDGHTETGVVMPSLLVSSRDLFEPPSTGPGEQQVATLPP